MSKQNLVFPTTKLLPMENIAEELKIIHGFQLHEENASDTDAVGGVSSEYIAVAATDEEGDPITYTDKLGVQYIKPRESVKNAEYLGGQPAVHYLSAEQGTKIQNFGEKVGKTFSDEIAALRDELYQLIGQLSRSGHIQEHGVYSGFQDYFKKSNKKYIYSKKTIDGDIIDSFEVCALAPGFYDPSPNVKRIVVNKAGVIKEGDWFVIRKNDVDENYLVQATLVEKQNTYDAVTFVSLFSTEGIPAIEDPSKVEIWKVLGDYLNGSFSFSKVEEFATTNTERVTMLNDDSVTSLHAITKSKTGYAATFKVPKNMYGALNYFSVFARSTGSPGALTCYIMDEASLSLVTDVQDALNKDYIIAQSQPVKMTSTSNILNEVKFKFADPYTYNKVILEDKRYAFVIVCEKCSATDRWEIQFARSAFGDGGNIDLQTNNKTYNYDPETGFEGTNAYGDLIFCLSVMEIKENYETPMTNGVYSSQKIKVDYNESLARARVTMRVNREGLYKSRSAGVLADNGTISFDYVKEDPGTVPSNYGFAKDDIVVVGNQFRKIVADCSSPNVTIDKAIAVNSEDEIYRVGYKVFLRAIKKTWKTSPTTGYVTTSDVLIPLQLKAVMKDDFKINDTYSDRLVFEGEFRDSQGNAIDANEFYLQIVWTSNVQKQYLMSNKDYVGRIFDLTLTFDRTI